MNPSANMKKTVSFEGASLASGHDQHPARRRLQGRKEEREKLQLMPKAQGWQVRLAFGL